MTEHGTVNDDAVDEAIIVLNRIHAADPSVLPALIAYRVPCNDALIDDPTVQVAHSGDEPCLVGLLGIINGLFGVQANGWGHIIADYGKDGTLHGFRRDK